MDSALRSGEGVRAATQNVSLEMIVLGIDPGTASTGFGVVASSGSRLVALDHGVIETDSRGRLERRLTAIHARVLELIDAHGPDAVAIEELFFGANVRTAFAVGQARGVVLLAAGQRAVQPRSYTPQAVKAAVCGHGAATKDQVGRMVAQLLRLLEPPTPDHAADALAVAICHLNRAPLARAISGAGRGGVPA
jgi:crossover junction endodeoxyribonuclease RuvC